MTNDTRIRFTWSENVKYEGEVSVGDLRDLLLDKLGEAIRDEVLAATPDELAAVFTSIDTSPVDDWLAERVDEDFEEVSDRRIDDAFVLHTARDGA